MDSPMCLIDNDDGELRVVPEAINYLRGIRQRVVVVAVVGLYRTGKSYLMNKLSGKREGFALGAAVQSKTKGIWMWCVPHPRKAELTLVLLDTEGLGDVEKGDAQNDAWIFSLAILLSSTLVFNSRGTIDNQAVESLQYVTELTDLIKVNSSNGASSADEEEEGADAQFVQFFPSFVWAVRDFFLELKIDGRDVTADEYLEHSLELRKGRDKKTLLYNLPRECIRNYFPSRKCFVFPTPSSPDNMSRLESMHDADLYPDFLQVSDAFCRYVFEKSRVKTVKGGHELTGSMLGHLAQTYVETIVQGAVPCLENAVLTMAKIENESAVREGLDVYRRGMEQAEASFPVDAGVMSDHHHRSNEQATKAFMSRSFKDESGAFLITLARDISNLYAELLIKNEGASEKRCSDLLKQLYEPVAQMMQGGSFAKPGGYELYCAQHDDLVSKYRSTPNKGVRAEEVLENFLRDRSVESKSILEADKQLTENERTIHEGRERVALAEQEMKVMREQQKHLEVEKQERERSQQATIQQLKIKCDQEVEQQKHEMERAMQSKLQELRLLQEKKFTEKEKLMREEITSLKAKMQEVQQKEDAGEQVGRFASMVRGVMQSVSEGLGPYFSFREAREQRKAPKYARRSGTARASGNVRQSGNTSRSGNVRAIGNVRQSGNTSRSGNVRASGNVRQSGNTSRSGNVRASGNVMQSGNTSRSGNVRASGNVMQSGNTSRSDNVGAEGNVMQSGNTSRSGNVRASGNVRQSDNTNNITVNN